MRRCTLLGAVAFAAACNDVSGPTIGFDEAFTLAPNDTVQVQGTRTSIAFTGVDGDSRCPADAVCIQGGDARVKINVVSGGSAQGYELHTGDLQPVLYQDLTISLVQLSPYPFSSTTIKPGDYRATLKVSR